MQNDKTLVTPEEGEPYREVQISDVLKLKAYGDRMIFMDTNELSPGSMFEISSADGMEVAKFIVHLLPIGQRLKVAASLTTSVAQAIG